MGFRRPFAGVFRGQSPRYGCFSDDLLGWRGLMVRTHATVVFQTTFAVNAPAVRYV
ncbi:hypothetical protein HMPREF3156_02184 [Neisseria sp. HMSC06F02]|nr:hypothetical protein HMPREF3156_02184 [Neisseria sp. HMSC06F02]